jgi:DNA-binding GntR family transcriptional regulator
MKDSLMPNTNTKHNKDNSDLLKETVGAADKQDDVIARIYQTVFDSVMSQRLTPGTKLPEATLSALFGVGRAVVQKALQKLAHDHIVELRPNRGAVVSTPTPEEVREIFDARRALESATLSLAIERITKADIKKLRKQLGDEHQAMHSFEQTEWSRLASSFHLRIAEFSRNPTLIRYMNELISRCSLIVALYEPSGHASCEHEEHARIVDLIDAGLTAEAIAAMNAHLVSLENHIHLVIQKSGTSLAHKLGMR